MANLREHGFAVLDNIIPPEHTEAVRLEVEQVTRMITQDQRPDRDQKPAADGLLQRPMTSQTMNPAGNDRSGRNNPIGLLPLFRDFHAHPVLLDIGRQLLDDHLRLAQINYRSIQGESADGNPGGFGALANRGKQKREWHTDWPHDLNAYGGGNPEHVRLS